MQPLEDHEDPLRVFGRDPDAVIAEREQPLLSFPTRRHRDAGGLLPGELQRVAEQVLEHRGEQRGLPQHYRQVARLDRGVRGPDRRAEVRPGLGEQHGAGDLLPPLGRPPHPAERQQVVDQLLHALGAVDGELDVLVGLLVQLARVAALQ